MTGRPVSLDDFQEVDPQLYRTLRSIESASEEELQAMNLTFETPDGGAFDTQQGKGRYTVITTIEVVSCCCSRHHSVLHAVLQFHMLLTYLSEP